MRAQISDATAIARGWRTKIEAKSGCARDDADAEFGDFRDAGRNVTCDEDDEKGWW